MVNANTDCRRSLLTDEPAEIEIYSCSSALFGPFLSFFEPTVSPICQHPQQLIEAFMKPWKSVRRGRCLMKSDLIKRYSCQSEHRGIKEKKQDKGEEASRSICRLFTKDSNKGISKRAPTFRSHLL